MKSLLLTGLLLLGLSGAAPCLLRAQDAPSLPSGPLLSRAANFSSWQITCTPQSTALTAAPASSSPAPASSPGSNITTIVKTKNIRKIEVSGTGAESVRWCYDSFQFLFRKGSRQPVLYGSPERFVPDSYVDFSRSDFPECAWISQQNYTGVKQVLGHTCFVFTQKTSTLTSEQQALVEADPQAKAKADSFTVTATVAVDVQTLLPVQAEVDNLSYTYTFLPAPTEMLVLPPQIQAQVQLVDQLQKDAARRPAHF